MLLTINPLQSEQLTQLEDLKVTEEQIGFVETITQILTYLNQRVQGHVIMLEKALIGFFLIDQDYPKRYDFCKPGNIGLRSFFIDNRYQGHGYGKQSVLLLEHYLSEAYSDCDYVYLTVNCKNPVAKRCYEQGGFIDTGEFYLGGDFGPQHIMKLSLKAKLK